MYTQEYNGVCGSPFRRASFRRRRAGIKAGILAVVAGAAVWGVASTEDTERGRSVYPWAAASCSRRRRARSSTQQTACSPFSLPPDAARASVPGGDGWGTRAWWRSWTSQCQGHRRGCEAMLGGGGGAAGRLKSAHVCDIRTMSNRFFT